MRAFFQSIAVGLFMGLALLLQISHAQIPSPTPADETVTKKENHELRAFSQNLLTRLRKTRDVRPLLKRYFAHDFATFSYRFFSDTDRESKLPTLNRSERKRFVVASLNFTYFIATYTLLGQADDLDKRLPASLRKQYSKIVRIIDKEDLKTRRSVSGFIRQIEMFTDDLRRYTARKKIESAEAYKTGIRKRQALEDYNFRVMADSPDPTANNSAARWMHEQGPDARTFTVGTPYGLAVVIIRSKGQYKALLLWPWPMSYDGRLN